MQISAQVPKTYSTNGLAGVIGPACGDQVGTSAPRNTPQDPPACTVHLEYYIRS